MADEAEVSGGEESVSSQSFAEIASGTQEAPAAEPAAPQRPDYLLEDYQDEAAQARAFGSLAKHYGGSEALRQRLYAYEMSERQKAAQPQAPQEPPKPKGPKWYEYDPTNEEARYNAMVKFAENPRQALLDALEEELGPLKQKIGTVDQIKQWRDQQEWNAKYGETWKELPPEWQNRVRRGQISMELIHEQHMEAKKARQAEEAKVAKQQEDTAEAADIKRERAANGRFASKSGGGAAPRSSGKKLADMSWDEIARGG